MTEQPREPSNPAIEAVRRHPLGQIFIKYVLPPLVAALVGVGYGQNKGEEVEDKARSGYRVTRADVEALKQQLVRVEARLDGELDAVRRAVRALSAGKRPPRVLAPAPAAPPAAAPSPPLPATLDKAHEETKQGGSP